MISLWHLLWIIPAAYALGVSVTAACVAAKEGVKPDEYDEEMY
jgi:hypothetical protein